MKRICFKAFSAALVLALLVGLLPFQVGTVQALSDAVVISQVYGAGGNSGALYNHDFVELFNRGSAPVSLDGMSVQYASATGTGNFGANPITALSGTLAPGQYYLVQMSGGSTGEALPTPDATGSASMAAANGKVALVDATAGLACNGSSTACTAEQMALIIDLVGYGTANFYEGTAAAPAASTTTSLFRASGGCVETDNNGADFAAAAPAPRNTASPLSPCVPVLDTAPTVTGVVPADGAVDVALDANLEVSFSEAVDVAEGSFSLSCTTSGSHDVTVSGGPQVYTLDPTVDLVAGDSCTLTVVAANVADQDSIDPPDTLAADYVTSFSTAPLDTAPAVSSTVPANGAVEVALDANLQVTFSEPVDAGAGAFTLSCSSSGSHTATVSTSDSVTYTIDPDVDFSGGDSCTLTVIAANVSDLDAIDPPDTLAADYAVTFGAGSVCQAAYTPIYEIQGSGTAAAITGTVTTQGVVVGDHEGASPALRGFFLQDITGDGNAATSDGIFVFNGGNQNLVAPGQVVRVTGTASDYQGQTQISTSAASIVACGEATVEPVDVTLPFASADAAEVYEGMLVRMPQTLYVTDTYQLGRFNEVVLSANARLQQPTNVVEPGAPALALQEQNFLNQILVDDASQAQNPDPITFARGGLPLSASNTLRGGDTATGIVGVMTYTWGGNAASPNAYRVRPAGALGGTINFEATNPRLAAAPAPTGRLRVAGMNLLNFFNTIGSTACTLGVGGGSTDCRGADSQDEYDRQLPKTVAAILGTGADVVGVIEIENDGYGAESALQALVDALNAQAGVGTYAFIDVDTATGQLNALGTDAIKVGLLYKPASVTPVGLTAALNSEAFVNGGDSAPRNRPALAQAFEEPGTGARFVVAVNHLKSKGSACDAPDAGDGQGNCNAVRTYSANLLTAWLAADPTGTGETDALILGDLNSYAMEDPIAAIKGAGYTDLINQFGGADAYSYSFDGQWGYLDHALSSASLTPQVSGVADWHINSDEPTVLDYNTDYKSTNQLTTLYAPDEFRIADHDPVLVDLNLTNGAPLADAGGPYSANEGETVALTATGSDPEGGAVTFAWDLNNDGVFETPGAAATFAALDGAGNYPVSVQVTDISGLATVATAAVDVANLAPALGEISAPLDPLAVGTAVTPSADFTDAGVLDTHTAEWDWGDGSTSAGTVTETDGSGSVSGSHAYAAAGIYTVTLTVTDKDGGSASVSYSYVIVYNPTSGFATGSGWYNSPKGAYPAKPKQAGKAIFSFVAKYLKGDSTPTGLMTMTHATAKLIFTSADYDWLVISGSTAYMQGTGKINGKGSYGFLLTVKDGGRSDAIRLKIWDKASGSVVYDTQLGADLPAAPVLPISGSIVVHK